MRPWSDSSALVRICFVLRGKIGDAVKRSQDARGRVALKIAMGNWEDEARQGGSLVLYKKL